MKKSTLILTVLFVISGIFYYQLTTTELPQNNLELHIVTRIIDGDTIELANSQKVRLKGINTPEKGDYFSSDATNFLKETIENKTIQLENHGTDKYGRTLGYVFYKDKNINKEILNQGLATLYYYGQDDHYDELKKAEEFVKMNQKGLWKESQNKHCVELLELKYKESPKRCTNNELIRIKNNCNFDIEATLKDDATHIYKINLKANQIFEQNFSCIWNNDGDTVYAWDKQGLLIFYRY